MTKRIIIMAILLAVLVLGGYGCMKKGQNIDDGALEYMKQKYSEEFEYVGPWGSSYATPGIRQILVSCDSLPDKEVLVVISGDGKEESYSDNYMDYLYEEQTNDYITKIANNYFSDIKVIIGVVYSPSADGVVPSTRFEDYILNENQVVNATIDIEDSDEEIIMKFANELKQLGLHFSIDIADISTNEGFTAQYFQRSDDIYLERWTLR